MRARVSASALARFFRAASATVKSKMPIGPIRLTIVCAALLSALVAIGTCLYLFDVRNRALASNEQTLANTVLIVSKQIERVFTTVATVQEEIVEQAADVAKSGTRAFDVQMSRHELHVMLRDKAAGMPFVGALTVFDAEGRLLNFSREWPVPNIDSGDREFIKAFQADPTLTSYLSEPVRNRANGTWVVHLVSKIAGPNGELVGLTTAAIELEYLQESFNQILFESGSGIALFRHGGALLARTPRTESRIGQHYPNVVGLRLVADVDQAVGRGSGVFDGTIRIVAAHRIGNYPLVVMTTRTLDMAFADWRQVARYTTLAAAMIIVTIAAFAALFIKLFKNYQALVNARAERANAEKLRDESRRLDVALNSMSQGLVMFDASERIVLCNRRYIDMYKLPPEAVVPGLTFRELLQIRWALGSISRDIEDYRINLLNELSLGKTVGSITLNANGRWHRVLNVPTAGGGWVATHEDVTEKVFAEKLIEQQKFQLDTALENMSQGLCMFDASQRLIVCNKRYAELYGLNDEQTKPGTSIRTILDHRIATGNAPDDHENYWKDRLSEVSINKPYQIINHLRDGRHISVVHRPTADGGWVATHEDVTEAIRREMSFRLLFDANPVPLLIFDLDGLHFLAVNDSAVRHYGFSREQFLQMTAFDIRPAEELEEFTKRSLTFTEVESSQHVWKHLKADGTTIDVVVYGRNFSYNGHSARMIAVHDITKAKLAEDELRRTKKFVDAVIEHIPLPIIVKDVVGLEADAHESRFTLFNRAYEDLTGDSRNKLIGKTAHEIFPKERADLIVQADNEVLRSHKVVLTSEHPIHTSHNGTRLVIAKKAVIRDDKGKPQYLLTVVDDVTERRRAEERITYLAHNDSLTDLPNRASFVDYLAETLDVASKTGEQFSILCLDLDRFKEANDVYGHLVGDGLLREVACRLRAAAAGAFLARVGGDEFTLIVKNGSQPAAAVALSERLIAAFQNDFEVDGHRLKLSLSIGGAVYPNDGADAKTLMANADAALYQAKAEAGGSVRFFAAELGAQMREHRAIQKDLQLAITQGEFFLHYQPQEKISSSETVGFEALVRWQCPKRGLVSPGEFIPLAEESSLIIPLGEWILREACREAATWPRPLTVAVNISPVQFHHGDLPKLVHSILLETGLAPARLELEITEGVLIDDFSRAVSILRKLKSLGVQIAMDDFGSGYSSLSYLHSFPFDKIKIDRSFIGDLEHNHHSMAIVRAIVTLGHSLDVPVLAEGVETEAQRQFLKQVGCDQVQGYLMGRPLLIEAYAKLTGVPAKPGMNNAAAG